MEHTGARRPERDRRKYRELRELHLAAKPNYEAGWHRPTPTTAEKVWELAAPGVQIIFYWPPVKRGGPREAIAPSQQATFERIAAERIAPRRSGHS